MSNDGWNDAMNSEIAMRKQNELIASIKDLEDKVNTVIEMLEAQASAPVKIAAAKKTGKTNNANINS